jgi:hypothetical protein
MKCTVISKVLAEKSLGYDDEISRWARTQSRNDEKKIASFLAMTKQIIKHETLVNS